MADISTGPRRKIFRSWSFGRILKRWNECWRLAGLPASGTAQTDRAAQTATPAPPPTQPPAEYVPKPGMRGKHVQWVPCSPVVLDRMLEMANVTADDYVIDPGSGDGRIVIRIAKLGARALGIEFNPKLAALSKQNAIKEGVGDRATFIVGDFFETDFSKATVITLFLRKDLNLKLRPRILDLKPGTRVVSNIFDMGDWEADEMADVEDGDYYFRNHTVFLWIVPAKVEGVWKLSQGELRLSQKFQMIRGSLAVGNDSSAVEGKMTGDRIDFTAGDRQFTGRVAGNRMDLAARGESECWWSAQLL